MRNFCIIAISIAVVALLNLRSVTGQTDFPIIIDAGELGRIRGYPKLTLGNSPRPYFTFDGIRYGTVPESKRFLPSVVLKRNLTGEGGESYFDAKSFGLACSQPNVVLPVAQSEECLYLNVHTPKLPQANVPLLPVVIYIHGGAFTVGGGGTYTGARLLNKDVVLVSINYRLGAFGFFTLDNEDVPGNAGLYDCLNALRWTKDFIRYFGGDPNRVTISGQSSGSVAVTHLLASPLAKGLFHGVLGASGSAISSWGTATPEEAVGSSRRLAEISGCPQLDVGEVAACMRGRNASTLVEALSAFQIEERLKGRVGFDVVSAVVQKFPVSEGFEREHGLIVPEHPEDVFRAGKQPNVPLLMGAARHDGSYVMGVLYQSYLRPNNLVYNTTFMKNDLIHKIFEAVGVQSDYGIDNSIAQMYLGETRKEGNFFELYPGVIDLLSVFFFKAPAYRNALYHSQISNQTYWYSFDYYGRYSLFGLLFSTDRPPIRAGISHGDDTMYLFDATIMPLLREDILFSERMVEYWTNFVIYGRPSGPGPDPSWPNLEEKEQYFCSIGAPSLALHHYEEHWSGVGFEVLPPTYPTRPPMEPTTTQPIEIGGEGGATSVSCSFYLYVTSLLIAIFSSSQKL